jgi:hypothetical protein
VRVIDMLRRNGLLVGLLLITSYAVVGQNRSTNPETAQPSEIQVKYPGLKLELRTNKQVFSLREEIVFEAAVLNTRENPVFLYNRLGWGEGGGLTLRIVDHRGKVVASPVLDDTLLPPPAANDVSLLAHLDEGQFFGTRRVVPISNLIRQPGQYIVTAIYASVLYPDLVEPELRDLPIVWQGHVPIASTPIRIEVKAGKSHLRKPAPSPSR